eukprot:jgi/Chrzof1/1233/Cz01g45200.t1
MSSQAGHGLDTTGHPLDILDMGWTRTGCPAYHIEASLLVLGQVTRLTPDVQGCDEVNQLAIWTAAVRGLKHVKSFGLLGRSTYVTCTGSLPFDKAGPCTANQLVQVTPGTSVHSSSRYVLLVPCTLC